MKTVSIIYHSGSGHTTQMAKAVAEGAASVKDIKVNLLDIKGSQIVDGRWQDNAMMEQLHGSDAIIFGSPTYMGSVSAQFKARARLSSQHKKITMFFEKEENNELTNNQ